MHLSLSLTRSLVFVQVNATVLMYMATQIASVRDAIYYFIHTVHCTLHTALVLSAAAVMQLSVTLN